LIRRLAKRSTRQREGLFIVEGLRGASEALAKGAEVRFAVCSPKLRGDERGRRLVAELERAGTDVSWIDDGGLEDLSDTETPQGVIVVCREPRLWPRDLPEGKGGFLLLDGVQDPGNVGTLVRAATAFGLGGVLALEGTADPWSPKAVRASAGAVFSIPVLVVPFSEVNPWLDATGTVLLVSDASATDVARVRPPERWALAVGNEGAGVRAPVAAAADATVGIPMAPDAESLNVGMAGAILLYVLTREVRS
jgi:TrmH family RNA methyltransferase